MAPLAYGQPASEPQRTEHPAHSEKDKPAPDQPVPSSVAGQEAARPKIYNPDCRQPKDHDEADLCVQREMAKAASDAVMWAERQTIIGCVGLLFVLATLWFTYRAADAGQKSAATAERALTTAERPYLFVEVVGYEMWPGWQSFVQYKFNNMGRTPALIVSAAIRVHVDVRLPDAPAYSEAAAQPDGALVVGPEMSSVVYDTTGQGQNDRELRQSADAGQTLSHFYDFVRYRDIFGNEYVSGFCWRHFNLAGQDHWVPGDNPAYSYHRQIAPGVPVN